MLTYLKNINYNCLYILDVRYNCIVFNTVHLKPLCAYEEIIKSSYI